MSDARLIDKPKLRVRIYTTIHCYTAADIVFMCRTQVTQPFTVCLTDSYLNSLLSATLDLVCSRHPTALSQRTESSARTQESSSWIVLKHMHLAILGRSSSLHSLIV